MCVCVNPVTKGYSIAPGSALLSCPRQTFGYYQYVRIAGRSSINQVDEHARQGGVTTVFILLAASLPN